MKEPQLPPKSFVPSQLRCRQTQLMHSDSCEVEKPVKIKDVVSSNGAKETKSITCQTLQSFCFNFNRRSHSQSSSAPQARTVDHAGLFAVMMSAVRTVFPLPTSHSAAEEV